jgi:ankyrin repeat protein
MADVVDLLLTLPDVVADPPGDLDSPLFLAAKIQSAAVMRSLLRAGADPMRRCWNDDTNRGFYYYNPRCGTAAEELCPTPLHALAGVSNHRGHSSASDPENAKQCFQLLLGAGCDLDAVDSHGKTPLHYSATRDYEISKLLVENGANIMAKDNLGNTPLHLVELSSSNGSNDTAVLLLKHGADINARRDIDGRTPIHTFVDTIHGIPIFYHCQAILLTVQQVSK